jgi:hypothetical protein
MAIIGFWLFTTAGLLYREVLPRLHSGGPPPFTVDLTDEASEQSIRWTLFTGGRDRGYARTWVAYQPADDTFELAGECKYWQDRPGVAAPDYEIRSAYRVTRDGDLLAAAARGCGTFLGVSAEGRIDARVEGGRLVPQLRVVVREMMVDLPLPPVAVPPRASVLNPQLPLNKIRGLRPGRQWRMVLLDLQRLVRTHVGPLGGGEDEFLELQAEVLPRLQPLPPLRRSDNGRGPAQPAEASPCLVVRYEGEDFSGHTWVRAADDHVLRQEVTRQGETVVLDRD